MAEPLAAFLAALGIVFVAEFADKTQFAILAMAGRGRPWRVFAGAVAAFAVMAVAAAVVGDLVGDRLPLRWVAVAAGVVFIGLGVWGLRHDADAEEHGASASGPDRSVARAGGMVAAFLLVLLAELGDRTQIAIVALAARNGHPGWTALGAALALAAVAGLTVLLGGFIRQRVPVERVEKAAAVLFILVGIVFVLTPWLPIPI